MKEFISKEDALAKIDSWSDVYARNGDERVAAIIEGIYGSINSLKTYTAGDFMPSACA